MELRDYQKECIRTIGAQAPGAYLCQMPTGCGKTATFTHIPRNGGRVLVLAHREELVRQPAKYYDCPVGFEIAAERSHGEDVVIASVQSLANRMDRFSPAEFDLIITDEAHHAAAGTYRKIYDHFTPVKHIGFTATPNRGDKAKLDDVYERIIFQRDLPWAIKSGYLCDIYCLRVNIGYDLSRVHTRQGDYAPGELAEAMEGTAAALELPGKLLELATEMEAGRQFAIKSMDILPFPTFHDAQEPLGFVMQSRVDGDICVFATDTVSLPYRFPGVNILAVEANFQQDILDRCQRMPEKTKHRVACSHMDIDTLCKCLAGMDLSRCREIVLLHLSDATSHEGQFINKVKRVVPPSVRVWAAAR